MYNSNRWNPIKTLNKGVTMLTIKKKFPITKPYMYGLSAFVVGYGAVMYGLITLPQRVNYDSLATLGINIGAVKDVKVEKAADANTGTAADQSTNAGIDVADQPSTATLAPATVSAPAETTPVTTTPVTEEPTVPVITPEEPADQIPPVTLPETPISDLLDDTTDLVDSILPL